MTRDTAFIDRISRPFQMFMAHKLSGACLLIGCTAVALVWANSPLQSLYDGWLNTKAGLALGDYALSKSIAHWINDGLMGIFFFVVGLEIKRELLAGELANPRQALLPILAALGGMAVPACIYIMINPDGPALSGWGIPMATDIAFALGILALFPVSVALKVFLTALAIVDDIGAILVVAIFYTEDIATGSLAIGGLLLLVSIGMNAAGVRNPIIYVVIGFVVWVAFLKSGVHATLAAVLMAFTIPARTKLAGQQFYEHTEALLQRLKDTGLPAGNSLLTTQQHSIVHSMEQVTEQATAPLQELEHALMPFVTFFILPVFALANAGILLTADFSGTLADPVALGVILGLVVGKPLGIWLFTLLAVKTNIARLPADVTLPQVAAVSMLAGVGFTMALFISTIAFVDPSLIEIAKTGVLAGSLISALAGCALLYATTGKARDR